MTNDTVTMYNDTATLKASPQAIASQSMNGHGISGRKSYHRSITPTNYNPTFRRHHRSRIYINIVNILLVFFLLIQIFDPAIQNPLPENPTLYNIHKLTATTTNSNNPSLSSDVKQDDRILSLLNDAGIANELSNEQRAHIPRWDQVIDLFGDDVVIVGKEDCERYRISVPLEQRQLGVAGMFNTGTNLLETQLDKNIVLPQASLWQVPWGKHRMADVKYNHTAPDMEPYDKDKVLPIVMIRDPFAWLQSMCASPYAAHWRHDKHHCPNMIPNEVDRVKYKNLQHSFEVTVIFDEQSKRHFQSLVHLWSEWYAQYLHVDYPILMIRYEDLVFQPAVVLHEIANCVAGTLHQPLHYQLKTSKGHGSGTDYIKALVKTADAKVRANNMTIQDLDYASQHLDHRLMNTFRYLVPRI